MPSIPSESSCVPGIVPSPSSVLTTGACSFSASSTTCFDAPEMTAPWPTSSTGRLDFESSSAALRIRSGSPLEGTR